MRRCAPAWRTRPGSTAAAARPPLGGPAAPRRAQSTWGAAPPAWRDALSPVNVLIGANVAVAAWWYAVAANDDAARRAFNRHFVLSSRGVAAGHVEALLLYAFAHTSPLHLLFNMMTLKSFGDGALAMLGSRTFTALYLGAGVAGGAAHVLYHNSVGRWPAVPASRRVGRDAGCVGASGAVAGVFAYVAARLPAGTTYILFVPVPNLLALGALAGGSAYALWDGDVAPGWAHAAHLGGAATGAALALARRRLRY